MHFSDSFLFFFVFFLSFRISAKNWKQSFMKGLLIGKVSSSMMQPACWSTSFGSFLSHYLVLNISKPFRMSRVSVVQSSTSAIQINNFNDILHHKADNQLYLEEHLDLLMSMGTQMSHIVFCFSFMFINICLWEIDNRLFSLKIDN